MPTFAKDILLYRSKASIPIIIFIIVFLKIIEEFQEYADLAWLNGRLFLCSNTPVIIDIIVF